MLKYLLVAVLAVVGSQAAFAQYYTLNALPMCWRTGGGVDSTIYMTQTDASQKTKPDRVYYYNATGNKVTVTGGSLKFGNCENPTTDSILVRLNVLIEDNDTTINLLNVIANAAAPNSHIVSELGCLMLYDTTEGCDVVGLTTTLNGIPPGWSSVYLNGTLVFGSRIQSCSDMAAALNAPIFDVPGTWTCYNDSLVVNPLDTSLFWRLDFVSHTTGDTITKFFNDTTEAGSVDELKIPVEIIKLVDSTGDIITLRYFSADGTVEYTGQGELTVGACPDAAETQFQDYISQQVTLLVEQGDCALSDEIRLASLTSNTTYTGNTLNSISILPISGTVTVNTDGAGAVTLVNGTEYWFGAEGCSYLQSDIVINITSGVVQVSSYY